MLGLSLIGPIVSMVKHRSPKPRFEVRVLVGPPLVRRVQSRRVNSPEITNLLVYLLIFVPRFIMGVICLRCLILEEKKSRIVLVRNLLMRPAALMKKP